MFDEHLTEPAEKFAPIARSYLRDEADLIGEILTQIDLSEHQANLALADARAIARDVRDDRHTRSVVDDILVEYGLSTDEGVALMRLAESLIRTPDFENASRLVRDKLGSGSWSAHTGGSFLVNQATNGLRLTGAWISRTDRSRPRLLAKLGDRAITRIIELSLSVMGDHFVLGGNIDQAMARARRSENEGCTHSFDMLGESAHTMEDADRYFQAYLTAIRKLAANSSAAGDMTKASGLSVKLSALHPRYDFAGRESCVPILVDRLSQLASVACDAGLWLNIDAEEADRLEVSLLVFERLLSLAPLKDWEGLGLVVQAYQRRALPVIDHLIRLAEKKRRKIAVRLVKGAYWDMEIKRAQEMGLPSYPVFTRKENTDVSYLACAARLLKANHNVFAQFATHNAYTAAAVAHMAGPHASYEFQRLYGMGRALHACLNEKYGKPSRVYAPVGSHKDLLPYLVRRLLENGANSSFVNQLTDRNIDVASVVVDPVALVRRNGRAANPCLPEPAEILDDGRLPAAGIDLSQSGVAAAISTLATRTTVHRVSSIVAGSPVHDAATVEVTAPYDASCKVGEVRGVSPDWAAQAVQFARASDWPFITNASDRASILDSAADLLEQERDDFIELCVREAGKTYADAVAEVREAVDFCRYYAREALKPTVTVREPLGTVACISPWNFPLAIFLGQITAALSVGNTVVAKPAEQTPIIAAKAVNLLYRAGVPYSALHLLLGDGAALGNALTLNRDIAGVCFTGSTRTAKTIAKNLADTDRGDIPLIAETGGLNTMIVDSTALLEQAVKDAVESAFQSAGQRCSACRIVCVQSEVYDPFVRMLTGAMEELTIGHPGSLSTDVGPVIDAAALANIENYKSEMRRSHRVLKECTLSSDLSVGYYAAPILVEVDSVSDVKREVFGPVLHIVKFGSREIDELVDDINALGYGLTMGLHTRLDCRVDQIANQARVGNLYVNRNQIGAVVGVHPFGGEGLSGTGPKAGGPHYLLGLTRSTQRDLKATEPVAQPRPPRALTAESGQVLLQARRAFRKWSRHLSLADRSRIVRTFLESGRKYEDHNCDVLQLGVKLSGPTGEFNTLTLFPRGVALCFGGDSAQDLLDQVSLALLAGSAAIAVLGQRERGDSCAIRKKASEPGLPRGLLSVVMFEDGLSLINESVNAIVADGTVRRAIAPLVCVRPGAILPILSAHDPFARFFSERTLTINTTAAGGNIPLLTEQGF